MTFISAPNSYRSTHFFPASLALFLTSFLSVLHVNFPAPIGSVSFLLLPLLVVSLWPRGVNAVVTIVTFCLMGIWMDWGTHGALGQWALTYLAVFAILRPDRREASIGFLGGIRLWSAGLITGVVMLVVTGWIVYGVGPNFVTLFKQACLVTIIMPPIVIIRNVVRYYLTDVDDRPY